MSTPSDYREVCIEEVIAGILAISILVILFVVLPLTVGILLSKLGWFSLLINLFR